MLKRLILRGLLTIFFFGQLGGEEPVSIEKARVDNIQFLNKDLKEETSVTKHSIKINGIEIPYTATAGTMLQKDDKGQIKASIFYVSYIKDGVKDNRQRPITFCFNGGPGSSSVWLHMGLIGPKRVVLQEYTVTPPPNQYVDNEYSFLDLTDLVFIDPVSTGYSHSAPGQDSNQFHGVEGDMKSVGEFIRLFTTRFDRWESPKFLAGESYGTTRAAGLSEYLLNDSSLYLNGIVLISSILDFQTIRFDTNNDLPYTLFLPSYTAAAWYHKKLDAELQKDLGKALSEAETFALNEYALALLQGDALEEVKKEKIIEKLARYTGLSTGYIANANLRVCMSRFAKELLRSTRRSVGRFDSRYLGVDLDACGDTYFDPFRADVFGAFKATFMAYVRNDLKWSSDEDYKILASLQWSFGDASNSYLTVTDNLCEAMTKNRKLKVFVASGYYDLATPYFSQTYTFRHLGLDPVLRDHVTMRYYDGGHMLYTDPGVLPKLKKDIAAFYSDTLKK